MPRKWPYTYATVGRRRQGRAPVADGGPVRADGAEGEAVDISQNEFWGVLREEAKQRRRAYVVGVHERIRRNRKQIHGGAARHRPRGPPLRRSVLQIVKTRAGRGRCWPLHQGTEAGTGDRSQSRARGIDGRHRWTESRNRCGRPLRESTPATGSTRRAEPERTHPALAGGPHEISRYRTAPARLRRPVAPPARPRAVRRCRSVRSRRSHRHSGPQSSAISTATTSRWWRQHRGTVARRSERRHHRQARAFLLPLGYRFTAGGEVKDQQQVFSRIFESRWESPCC